MNKEKNMERKIVKKIGNLEMDENGIVYKTSKGGFIPPALPQEAKIPYPKIQPGEKAVCGLYPSEIEFAIEKENIDQMNALKELHYQAGLKAGYLAMQKTYRQQQRRKIARNSFAIIIKAMRHYREYKR